MLERFPAGKVINEEEPACPEGGKEGLHSAARCVGKWLGLLGSLEFKIVWARRAAAFSKRV